MRPIHFASALGSVGCLQVISHLNYLIIVGRGLEEILFEYVGFSANHSFFFFCYIIAFD